VGYLFQRQAQDLTEQSQDNKIVGNYSHGTLGMSGSYFTDSLPGAFPDIFHGLTIGIIHLLAVTIATE
jgi:hypothetical protein